MVRVYTVHTIIYPSGVGVLEPKNCVGKLVAAGEILEVPDGTKHKPYVASHT